MPPSPGKVTLLSGERYIVDIQRAIDVERDKIELTPVGHPDLGRVLGSLGTLLTTKFTRTGDLADIQEAVSVQQKAIQLTPPNHPNLPLRLCSLGNSLYARFNRRGDLADIEEAIAVQRRACETTPTGHAELPRRLVNFGNSLQGRFNRVGDLVDIKEAISLKQKAVELTAPNDPSLPLRLVNLGNSLHLLFDHTGNLADIQAAISIKRKAIEFTPPGHIEMPRRLLNLGTSFRARCRYTGDPADIQNAISVQQKAAELTPPGHADLPHTLNNLGNSYRTRFDHMGDPADIREAISVQRRVIELTPSDHPGLSFKVGNLGCSLQALFDYTGDLTDIQEAISLQQRAVILTPPDHAHLPHLLGQLANSFQSRFDRMGDLVDLQEVISAQQEAVDVTPPSDVKLAGRLDSLANSLTTRFDHTRELSDLQRAITLHQKAVELIPPDHAELPVLLINLGSSFETRFIYLKDPTDIQQAISLRQKAVHLTPLDHAHLPHRLGSLGLALKIRYNHVRDPSDIQEAVSVLQRAVDLTPLDHADLPNRLFNLGVSFHDRSRFEPTASSRDSIEAIDCYRRAANASIGAPSVCLSAAKSWARLCQTLDPPQSLTAFAKVIALLSQVAGLEQTLHSRHRNIRTTGASSLSLEAAAAAFSYGMPDEALEWLEQGRCIVWTQLNNLRTPFDSLRIHNPNLAERVLDVSKALEKSGTRTTLKNVETEVTSEEKLTLQAEAKQHIELSKEWDRLLVTVRGIPGFETFLLPTPVSILLDGLPDLGPTVVINVHKRRCDALALFSRPGRSIHVPLPQFSYAKASRLCKQLIDASRRVRGSDLESQGSEEELQNDADVVAEHGVRGSDDRGGAPSRPGRVTIKAILRILWVDLVKPIIDHLGYLPLGPGAGKPRIWWCTTGPLAFLPLHAAGIYGGPGSGSKLSDFAVSSYTPSVGTLVQCAHYPPIADENKQGMFMVSQPHTPGQRPIPATTNETRIIEAQLHAHGVPYFTLEGQDATVQAAMANIEKYNSIHFACHATQNIGDPLKSSFFFHDGALELSSIIKADLKHADLAFLSACQTSKGDEQLSEEAVHLAAGMLAAGYRSVIATMWSIQDDYAPTVADLFYKEILDRETRTGGKGINGSHAAYALHNAIRGFHELIPGGTRDADFFAWIPYVPIGL